MLGPCADHCGSKAPLIDFEAVNRIIQAVWSGLREKESGDAVPNRVQHPSALIGNDGFAAGHGLDGHDAEILRTREDQGATILEQSGGVFIIYFPDERCVF